MKSRVRTSQAFRELTHIKNVRSETAIHNVSPENTEKETFKMKTVTINAPNLNNMGDRLVQRFSHQPQLVKSITSSNSSFNFGKSKSFSDNFYFPAKSFALRKKASEDLGELVPSKAKNSSYSQGGFSMNLNTRQKVRISQFLLENNTPISPVETLKANRKAYKSSNSLSGILLSRPATTTFIKRRPSIKMASEQSLTFKTRLNVNDQNEQTDVLKQIRSLGSFKKRAGGTSAQPGFFQVQAPQVNVSPKMKSQDPEFFPKNFWFTLNHDVCTKTTIEHQIAEKRKAENVKEVNKKIIAENRDKLMICLDPNCHTGPFKYCFMRKELRRNVAESPLSAGYKLDKDFKIKICEVQTKLRLNSDFRFLYLLDGCPVYDFNDIPSEDNIVIISKGRELGPIDEIIQQEIVRDFYEYNNKKDNTVFYKNQVESKMYSLLESIETMGRKYQKEGRLFQTEKLSDEDPNELQLAEEF